MAKVSSFIIYNLPRLQISPFGLENELIEKFQYIFDKSLLFIVLNRKRSHFGIIFLLSVSINYNNTY